MTKKVRITLLTAVLLVLASVIGCGVYVSDYYHADEAALAAMAGSDTVTVRQTDDLVTFSPEEPAAGFIFYPGGKVEHTAYAPLILALAQRNILCVLVEMPFRLAVLDVDAAEGIAMQFPEIENWYIGGHSLGGSMAASYAGDHAGAFDGLVLLAAYSTADLTATPLEVISLYGSEGSVLNMEKYESYFGNLPDSVTETVIDGGNHAGFGNYGAQEGDGEATIDAVEQCRITGDLLAEFMIPNSE